MATAAPCKQVLDKRYRTVREHVLEGATQIHASHTVTRAGAVTLPSEISWLQDLWARRPSDGGRAPDIVFAQLSCLLNLHAEVVPSGLTEKVDKHGKA